MKVNITELDISLFTKEQKDNRYKDAVPPEVLAKQAARYAAMFEIFRRHRDVIDRVTFWGATDRHTWLNYHPVQGRADHPLLFDRAGQPKPAFWAVIDPSRVPGRPGAPKAADLQHRRRGPGASEPPSPRGATASGGSGRGGRGSPA